MQTPVGITLDRLSVRLGNQSILQSFSVDVVPGSIVSIVGASGCGKSTLLRVIAGLQTLTSGEVTFSSGQMFRRQTDLGFVFQDPTLLPWRTVEQNARLPLELLAKSMPGESIVPAEWQQVVKRSLETVGLASNTHALLPRQLSGGMKMRTSIARALITDPSVLLLDEPFAALDDLLRQRLNDLLLQLWQERPRTILFVTHNISEAIYLSHRILVLGNGTIQADIKNVLPHPRSIHTRRQSDFSDLFDRVSTALLEVDS